MKHRALPDAESIRSTLLAHVRELVADLLPQARPSGTQIRVGSLAGESGQSLAIDTVSGLWIDHATSEKGDLLELIMRTRSLDFTEALRFAQRWLGGSAFLPADPIIHPIPRPAPAKLKSHPWRILKVADDAALAAISHRLDIGLGGLGLARERGHLFTTSGGFYCITDSARHARADRRLDGQPVRLANGQGTKSRTLGSATWPVGAADIGDRPCVLLCEGVSDFLSAHQLIHAEGLADRFCACAALGASISIHPEALAHFHGKAVLIFADADDAGVRAARRWRDQLGECCRLVRLFDLRGLERDDGHPVKDLRDFLRLGVDAWESDGELREPLTHFAKEALS